LAEKYELKEIVWKEHCTLYPVFVAIGKLYDREDTECIKCLEDSVTESEKRMISDVKKKAKREEWCKHGKDSRRYRKCRKGHQQI